MASKLFGTGVTRREDVELLTTGGRYVADLDLEGVCAVHYVVSTMAHARLLDIDVSEAKSAPGVLDIVTSAELDEIGPYPLPSPLFDAAMERPLLATGKVRFVGEPIVAIIAETETAARDAAELVVIEYEPLPVVVNVEEALTPDPSNPEVLLFDGTAEGNVVCRMDAPGLVADFDSCDVVVKVRTINNRVAAAPIEPRVAAAEWGDDGRLHHYNAGQGPYPVRAGIAAVMRLEPDQIRVRSKDVGGSFGAKARPHPEEAILGHLARRVGRPVRWNPPRSDDMVGLSHGRGQVQYCTIGGTRDGRITAYKLHIVQESGAYPMGGAGLPSNARTMLTGCYDIASVEFTSVSVVTNTTPTGAYRGAGRPEAAAAIERAVDAFAAELGLDPVAVRRKNLLPPSAFPHVTPTGTPYDSGDYERVLDLVLAASDYEGLRAEQSRRRDRGDNRLLGIGLATYVERTAGASRAEHGSVELKPDGTLLARTGATDYGQGHETSWAMLIADQTGVNMDDIEILYGDTDLVPWGGVTGGSRSVQLAGPALSDAAAGLSDQARSIAATLLEAAVDDVTLDVSTGRFHVVGTPAVSVGWTHVAEHLMAAQPVEAGSAPRILHSEEEFESSGPTFPFGTHVAVVEVDAETGAVELLRLFACDDAGTILNPLLAGGQVHGGLAQGAAQALLEEFIYDNDGNPLTANFADYPVISATEVPMFDRIVSETPTHINPLGAKGIGEAGTVGSTPAIQNAVIDAVAHLGIRHIDMPLTPQKVWRAMTAAL
ncbi:MAG: carbon-monoxide dehydrogenase large subunit [Candidatus Poriferisodalaceae bacterium]|jgi:carbon-monoxide dehydrogenase large subunit